MKKLIILIYVVSLFVISCFAQKDKNFVNLFDGSDLKSWDINKEGGFEIVDGELVSRSIGDGHDIYTKKSYANFIFHFEFLLSQRGNSGVFIRCKPTAGGYFSAGFEVQLLAPWTPWRDDLHCTGSIYGLVPVTNRPDETPGKWYKMEIICDRNMVTISVNDQIVTKANVDTLKAMPELPYFGAIGFQGSHTSKKGQFAKFRNISICDLDLVPDYVVKGFYEGNEKLRTLAIKAAVKLGTKMIGPLADLMSGDNPMAKNCAKQAIFDITAKISDPQTSMAEKEELAKSLKVNVNTTSDKITKDYLKWLSGMINK